MESGIDNVEMLKLVAGQFVDLVKTYFAMFYPYHSAIHRTIASILLPTGLAWTAFLMLKFPADKLKATFASMALLGICTVLVSVTNNTSALFPAGNTLAGSPVSNGTYYGFSITGTVYTMLSRTIRGVDSAQGTSNPNSIESAVYQAYGGVNEDLVAQFSDSPVGSLYKDYLEKCTKASMDIPGGNVEDTLKTLQYVGIGGTGIGAREADRSVLSAIKNDLKGRANAMLNMDSAWDAIKMLNPLGSGAADLILSTGAGAEAYNIDSNITKAESLLAKIPVESDPFASTVNQNAPEGYVVPTAAYWKKKAGGQASDPEFEDAKSVDSGAYLRDGVTGSAATASRENFHPKSCLEAFKVTNLAIQNWRTGYESSPEFKGNQSYATMKSISATQRMFQNIRKRANLNKAGLSSAVTPFKDSSVNGDLETGGDLGAGILTEIGTWIGKFFTQYKIPFMISGSAMCAAALLAAFPVFAFLSIFLGPRIIISFFKILAFLFLVIWINDLFLSVGGRILAVSQLVASGNAIGQHGNSLSFDIIDGTAKAIIFLSITAIEIVIARLLIWDDAKSVGSFNPTAAFGTNVALAMGAMATMGSLITKPVAVGKAVSSGVSKGADSVAGGAGSKVRTARETAPRR